jgi:hypothetical protein
MPKLPKAESFAFGCGLILLAIWPLPNTMLVRNLALFGGACAYIWICFAAKREWRAHINIGTHIIPLIFFAGYQYSILHSAQTKKSNYMIYIMFGFDAFVRY